MEPRVSDWSKLATQFGAKWVPHLPAELRRIIFGFACRLPPLDAGVFQERSALDLDIPTTLTLCLVSCEVYIFIAPILYDDVAISRPSKLRSFSRALLERPSLGRLVRSLWIGDIESLPRNWWPLQSPNDTECTITSSIQDVDLLPRGVMLGHQWPLTGDPPSLQVSSADQTTAPPVEMDEANLLKHIQLLVVKATQQVGSDKQGIDPMQVGRSRTDVIGEDEWHVRVFEIQARLDTALQAIKRDGHKWRAIEYYLGLPLEWSTYVLDRFDHPLLLARSGIVGVALDPSNQYLEEIEMEPADHAEDFADRFSTRNPRGRFMTYNTYAHSTVGGILSTARSVLAMLPRLQHMGCSGYLDRVIVGTRPIGDVLRLRTLVLGPSPQFWDYSIRLDHQHLSSVQSLIICDRFIDYDCAVRIAGHHQALPCLKQFHWLLFHTHDMSYVAQTLESMVAEPADNQRGTSLKISLFTNERDGELFQSQTENLSRDHPRLILQCPNREQNGVASGEASYDPCTSTPKSIFHELILMSKAEDPDGKEERDLDFGSHHAMTGEDMEADVVFEEEQPEEQANDNAPVGEQAPSTIA
ncbi:unnamed protein product [Sympodiomycopsis kandeliae]